MFVVEYNVREQSPVSELIIKLTLNIMSIHRTETGELDTSTHSQSVAQATVYPAIMRF